MSRIWLMGNTGGSSMCRGLYVVCSVRCYHGNQKKYGEINPDR